MKKLSIAKRFNIAIALLNDQQLEAYTKECRNQNINCEHNSQWIPPVECENINCVDCKLTLTEREKLGCSIQIGVRNEK